MRLTRHELERRLGDWESALEEIRDLIINECVSVGVHGLPSPGTSTPRPVQVRGSWPKSHRGLGTRDSLDGRSGSGTHGGRRA